MAVGLLAALTIRNPARPAAAAPAPTAPAAPAQKEPTWNCGVSGPPLNPSLVAAADRPA